MKRKLCIIVPLVILITWLLLPNQSYSQSYIDFSKYAGGSGQEYASKMQVVNGETYLVGVTESPNFPATTGAIYKGRTDITVTKYGNNGTVLYSTILGSPGFDQFYAMKVINGEVYLLSTADSSGYPVTNGSTHKGKLDIVVTRLGTNGTIIFATYIGGTNDDYPINITDLEVIGNEIYFAGSTESPDFPVTSGIYHGVRDGFIVKLNASTGNIILSNFYGGSESDNSLIMFIENGFIYLIAAVVSSDLTVTIGGFPGDINIPTQRHIYIKKINAGNFNTVYARYLGGNSEDFTGAAKVVNGVVYIAGFTYSQNFPVTNGTTASGQLNDPLDGFYTKLNTDGSIAFSTYLASPDLDFLSQIIISNGDVYLIGFTIDFNINGQFITIQKINANGTFAYSKKIHFAGNNGSSPDFELVNGELYFGGYCLVPDYPVTNNSQYNGEGTLFFTHLDQSGNTVYSTFLGKVTNFLKMKYANNKFYFLGQTNFPSFPVTDSSVIKGGADNIVIVLKPDGTNVFTSYIGGSLYEIPSEIVIDNDDIYIDGRTGSNDYPVTNNILFQGGLEDQFVTKISFCPTNYDLVNDTLSPKIQTVCQFGLAKIITGEKIMVPSDSLPPVYLNGISTAQKPIEGTYQWQVADAPTGPWIDIPTATFKDYRPIMGSINRYYRRLAFASPGCGTALIHTSDTATALVSSLTAPVVDAGGPFYTCPATAITIGGSPTATGGNPPYTSYVWDMNAGNTPNPTVSPNVHTLYTLIVTDNLGCQQIDQALVFAFRANAGADKSNCAGVPVKIGSSQIPGVPGIVYAWLPATALTNAAVAQPFANPVVTTNYELTLTVPKSGGGTCSTKDTVRVIPVAAPLTPGIAGPDKVICLGDNASLGNAPEAGFNYIWSPGSYLNSNTTSNTTYYPGQFEMPIPNPATIHLTAQKDGCSFPDEVVVATIEARAGLDGCGPRYVGEFDRTPNINETYLWTKISGPGNFTGATDLPQVPVSASVGGTTIYGLLVSYNGGSCYDEVAVPEICGGCGLLIGVNARYKCPGFNVNFGDVTLYVSGSIPNGIYTWEPHAGLDTYTGPIVHLTDNVPRTYTVTMTDANDTSYHCSGQIAVNNPLYSVPVFPAPNVTGCVNTPIAIGLPPVAGYNYEWIGLGLSDNFASNPIATVPYETTFPVVVEDDFGCTIHDTVTVFIQNVNANAGDDWVVCSTATVQLGTPAQPNTTYVWEPQASPWQNGTDQFSAQPQVLAATDLTYTLTATTSAGCITTDDVNVTINNNAAIPDAPNQIICINSSAVIGSPALPGVIYQWTPTTGLNSPNIAQPIASPTVTTTYSLLATFTGSCAIPATDQVTVTVSDPTFNIPDIHFCPANGAFALGTAAPLNMNFYLWQPIQLVTDNLIRNPSTLNPPPNTTTVFTLFVVNSDGCGYTDSITIIPAPALPDAGTDKIICKSQTTTIGNAANPTGPGISYSWSPATNLDNPTSTIPVFTGAVGGEFTYILTITDNSVSCSARDTVIIKVIDSLIPVLNTATICQNSCVHIGTTPIPGVQYHWTPVTGLSNATIANPLACVAAVTANYTLTATDQNGCSSSASVVVGVNALPAAQINIPTVTACVGDNNVMFNPVIFPPGTYSYLWSPDDGTLSDVNIFNPTIIIGGTGTTQYVLQVTDDLNGCTNTAIANLVVNTCSILATVSDFMWFDTNTNGLQDPGELGVSGMSVKLYNNLGIVVATAVTDANGLYSFVNISPGNDYYVIFNKPTGYDFTLQNIGGITASNNSKVDQNGRSNNFNIPTGANITNVDAGIKPTGGVPVTLLSFTATLLTREVLLNWQTTAEYNNHYFDVERSIDGNHFIAIGRVNGNGTTSLPHNYSLLDQHPVIGLNYYRLKQVDFDGHSVYSQVEVVRLINNEIVSAFYNSDYNIVQIVFSKPQDKLHVELYAANGQLIRSATTANNISGYTLDLPPLAAGIYMLQVVNEKFNYSKKILVNK